MTLQSIHLQQFRNYQKADFSFSPTLTFVIGPNTAGKTNLLDSIHLLSTGRSFVADKDEQLIRFHEDFSRIKGMVCGNGEEEFSLEVLLTHETGAYKAGKRFFVNGVPRRRIDFTQHLPTLLFTPMDLEIISGGPSQRRNFLDELLEQIDREYQQSMFTYTKALRQRNALLEQVKESGYRNDKLFHYWDELLITQGDYIHRQRQKLIDFLNKQKKDIFTCYLEYDHSIISEERLTKYRDAEQGSGLTLVGPHRDDFFVFLQPENRKEVKVYASRGQQRLAVLQLKVLQMQYMQQCIQTEPLLILDDIFSELDSVHINLVTDMIGKQQTIISSTHKEFISAKFMSNAKMIELEKES